MNTAGVGNATSALIAFVLAKARFAS